MMQSTYLPLLIFLMIGVGFGIAPLIAGRILGPNRPGAVKNAAYECGFARFSDARMKFDVRYYLVAILFIIFDLELAFMFPWSVVLTKVGWAGFISMIFFLALLAVGFVYEWRKGALEWE